MPNIDREFVEKLESFTQALGDVVDILKQEADKKETDVTNKLLNNMPDVITKIAEDIAEIKSDVNDIKTTTEDLKKAIKDVKSSKETGGLFDKISEPDNKKRIVDGVKVITLIAGGVLAIGAAFKIIGNVDYKSVLSLSFAVLSLSYAFVLISKSFTDNKIGKGDIFKITSVLPSMSLGIAISSVILSRSATLSKDQLISVVGISVAVGSALYFMTGALDKSKMKRKHLAQFMLLPVALPLLSTGIWLSSIILSGTKTLQPNELIAIGVVSLALSISLYTVVKALDKSKMQKKHMAQFLLLPLVIPIIAGSIVAASWIFKMITPIKWDKGKDILITSAIVGGSTLAMMPAIILISKFKVKMSDISRGAATIIVISAAILAASLILSIGTYDENKVPPYGWTLKTGLAVGAFGIVLFAMGKYLKESEIRKGAISVLAVAGAIYATSLIISQGDYNESSIPGYEWTLKVGLSLVVFGGIIFLIGSFVKADKVIEGGLAIVGIAGVIFLTSVIISEGTYKPDSYPPIDWALGVGLSILVMGALTVALGFLMMTGVGAVALGLGMIAMAAVSVTTVEVARILSSYDWDKAKSPPLKWTLQTGLSMITFGAMAVVLGLIMLSGVGAVALYLGAKGMSFVSDVIINVAKKLNEYDWTTTKSPSTEWIKNVGLSLSLFSGYMLLIGGIALTGIGLAALAIGYIALPYIAKSIVTVAKKLGEYDWSDTSSYPSEEWVTNVGRGFKIFAVSIGDIPGTILSKVSSWLHINPLETMAKKMGEVADELAKHNWRRYPKPEFIKGIMDSISIYSSRSDIEINDNPEKIAIQIGKIADELSKHNWTKYPKPEFIKGIMDSILIYSSTSDIKLNNNPKKIIDNLVEMGDKLQAVKWDKIYKIREVVDGMYSFVLMTKMMDTNMILKFKNLKSISSDISDMYSNITDMDPKKIEDIANFAYSVSLFMSAITEVNNIEKKFSPINSAIDSINKLSEKHVNVKKLSNVFGDLSTVIKSVSTALTGLNTESLDNLMKFSGSMLTLSLVDEAKLDDFIEVVTDNKEDLSEILSTGKMQTSTTAPVNRYVTENITKSIVEKPVDEKREETDRFNKLISHIERIDKTLTEMLDVKHVDAPDNFS